eukprot:1726875-Alexandrium_andersonii.AAC.1
MRRGSKRWWRLSTVLLSKVTKVASPALRLPDGTWAIQPKDKANALADAFLSKWQLPDGDENEFLFVPSVNENANDDFLPL